jgi:hypothetical protein
MKDTTTILIMTILKTHYTIDKTYNEITYNISKRNTTYMFLSTVISKVICK